MGNYFCNLETPVFIFYVFITEIYLTNIWRDNWRSLFDVVKGLHYWEGITFLGKIDDRYLSAKKLWGGGERGQKVGGKTNDVIYGWTLSNEISKALSGDPDWSYWGWLKTSAMSTIFLPMEKRRRKKEIKLKLNFFCRFCDKNIPMRFSD